MVALSALVVTASCASPEAQGSSDGTSPSLAPVTPVVVYAGIDDGGTAVRVDAYVAELVEAGGTCVVLASSGDRQVEAESVAVPDATTTWCEETTFSVADLETGAWDVVVTYRSPTSEGTSDSVQVQVP